MTDIRGRTIQSPPQSAISDVSHRFFSVLPFGLNDQFDLSGWVLDRGPRGDGRVTVEHDAEIESYVAHVQTDTCDNMAARVMFPDENMFIGTPLPVLTLHIKNLSKHVAIEIEIEDDAGTPRIIMGSTAQSVARLRANNCSVPLKLTEGWNRVVLDLQQLTQRMFATNYRCCARLCVYASCRVRRVFFSDRQYREADLPLVLRVRAPLDDDEEDEEDMDEQVLEDGAPASPPSGSGGDGDGGGGGAR